MYRYRTCKRYIYIYIYINKYSRKHEQFELFWTLSIDCVRFHLQTNHVASRPITRLNKASVEESSSKHLSTIPQVPKSRKDNQRVTFVCVIQITICNDRKCLLYPFIFRNILQANPTTCYCSSSCFKIHPFVLSTSSPSLETCPKKDDYSTCVNSITVAFKHDNVGPFKTWLWTQNSLVKTVLTFSALPFGCRILSPLKKRNLQHHSLPKTCYSMLLPSIFHETEDPRC